MVRDKNEPRGEKKSGGKLEITKKGGNSKINLREKKSSYRGKCDGKPFLLKTKKNKRGGEKRETTTDRKGKKKGERCPG